MISLVSCFFLHRPLARRHVREGLASTRWGIAHVALQAPGRHVLVCCPCPLGERNGQACSGTPLCWGWQRFLLAIAALSAMSSTSSRAALASPGMTAPPSRLCRFGKGHRRKFSSQGIGGTVACGEASTAVDPEDSRLMMTSSVQKHAYAWAGVFLHSDGQLVEFEHENPETPLEGCVNREYDLGEGTCLGSGSWARWNRPLFDLLSWGWFPCGGRTPTKLPIVYRVFLEMAWTSIVVLGEGGGGGVR